MMSKEEHENMTKVENELLNTLQEVMKACNSAEELAQKAAELHRQWLQFYWGSYDK